jgi:bacterioferritin
MGAEREDLRTCYLEQAVDSAQQADQIAERICQLGGKPDYSAASQAMDAPSVSLVEMIEEGITADQMAALSYSTLITSIGDGDPVTRGLLERVRALEVQHATDLLMLATSASRSEGSSRLSDKPR